jgi:hypothetical protein
VGGKQFLTVCYKPQTGQAVLNIRRNTPNCSRHLRRFGPVFFAQQHHHPAGGQNVYRGRKFAVRNGIANGVAYNTSGKSGLASAEEAANGRTQQRVNCCHHRAAVQINIKEVTSVTMRTGWIKPSGVCILPDVKLATRWAFPSSFIGRMQKALLCAFHPVPTRLSPPHALRKHPQQQATPLRNRVQSHREGFCTPFHTETP